MSFCCKIGLHVWIYDGKEDFVDPLRGPFDPRDEKRRTWTREMQVCAKCGERVEYDPPSPY